MNQFIKKFVQIAVLTGSLVIAGNALAANFDPQPMGNHGFTTINTNCSQDCANQKNSISYNELPASKEFTVYLNFHNNTPGDINNAVGKVNYAASGSAGSATFTGQLSGSGASTITDTATITNLPANWQIQFVSGFVRVEEHYSNQGTPCTGTFPGTWPWQHSFSNPSNAPIGTLHYFNANEGGWCDQGYVFAKFKIVDTTVNDPTPVNGQCRVYNGTYSTQPATNTATGCLAGTYQDTQDTQTQWKWQCNGLYGGATTSCSAAKQTVNQPQYSYAWGWGSWGSCIDDVRTRTAQCLRSVVGQDTAPVVVNDALCLENVGPKPAPQTQSCGFSEDNLSIETLGATNITQSSAKLNGRVLAGNTNYVYFVLGTNSNNLTCSSNNKYFPYDFNHPRVSGDMFSYTFPSGSLSSNATYYYRACAQGVTGITPGQIVSFKTKKASSNENHVEIVTEAPQSVTKTTADLCANLVEDGGSQVQTWIEYRKSSSNSWSETPTHQRYAGYFCQSVTGLSSNTSYVYRACTPEGCASQRTFKTLKSGSGSGSYDPGEVPIIITDDPTNVRSNGAILNGTYVTNAPSGTCWFEYGRTANLGSQTRSYSVGSGYGTCVHNFTNLAANQLYCVRAVIQTVNGTSRGGIKCFTTPGATSGGTTYVPPRVIVVEENPQVDLSALGLGLSLVRLDIDDHNDVVFPGQQVTYEVTWENISHIDLDNLQLKVTLPSKITITSASRGRINPEDNSILYMISDLRSGERGELTIGGLVGKPTIGTALTAQAELAYKNPINFAQENALDFDINDVGTRIAGVTASIFGLGNITFLGWLVILLGLFIIFLIARYLYLEREELRAQAYMSGYSPYNNPPNFNPRPQDDYYNPYRPNRG